MRNIAILTALILMACGAAAAQDRETILKVGAYGAFNLNNHKADFSEVPGCPSCSPGFRDGSGTGLAGGILVELPLPPQYGLGVRLGISQLNSQLTRMENIGNTEELDPPGVTDAMSEHLIDAKISVLAIEPYFRYKFFKGLWASAGVNFGVGMTHKFDQKETLKEPNGVVFKETDTKTRNEFHNLDIPDFNSMQMFGAVGLGYELPLGSRASLSPEVKYFLPFTKVSNLEWKANTLALGVSVTYDIWKPLEVNYREERQYIRDTTTVQIAGLERETIVKIDSVTKVSSKKIDETNIVTIYETRESYERRIPRLMDLKVDLSLFGMDNRGVRTTENPKVVIEETEVEELFPLLPYVFFAEGSSDLASAPVTRLTGSERAAFTDKSLPWETLGIYSNMLNLVGYRMTQKPAAKLTITGTNNNLGGEAGNTALSRARAESVKSYLTEVWDIAPSRIAVKAQNLPDKPSNNATTDGQTENRRAELSSNDLDILRPVSLAEIERTATPPVVEIVPDVKAEAGVDSWAIDVSQAETNLRNYTGKGAPEPIRWRIEEKPSPLLETPVKFELTATDVAGQTKSASKSITIEQITIKKKREIIRNDFRIERFALILFDFDKAELKEAHKQIVYDIKKRVQPDSRVTISGYADRQGTPEYNRELARKRALEVQKILGVAEDKLTINPVGSDELLYDNDLPQGRSYSRTVRIEIETPVK